MEHQALSYWHLVATGGGGMLGTIALVWRMWVKPAQDEAVRRGKWETQVEARLSSGEKAFARHKETDDELRADIKEIKASLKKVELQLAKMNGE